VAEAHRRLEAGGLDGKLLLVPGPPVVAQPSAAAACVARRRRVRPSNECGKGA
jgi:hypothetical protein